MRTKSFIFLNKYHITFTILYILAFSMLLTGMHNFCRSQETATCTQARRNLSFSSDIPLITPSLHRNTQQNYQPDIAKNVLRLHVIANSDSEADQTLKLAVRDGIIGSLQTALKNADSCTQASKIILTRKSQIEKTACNVLRQNGCNASISVSLENRYFPVKEYGDLRFPAGTYQALCVEIGKAEGKNWWCVLFPSLCFVDETTATVPDSSKKTLQESLPKEAYQSLLTPSATASPAPEETLSNENSQEDASRPELHFGIAEWFQETFTN